MKLSKNLIARLFITTFVLLSVTSCALFHNPSHNKKGGDKGNHKKEVKSHNSQPSNKR